MVAEAQLLVHAEGRTGVEGAAPYHFPFEEGGHLTFDLLLQIAEVHAGAQAGLGAERVGVGRASRRSLPFRGLEGEAAAGEGADEGEGLAGVLEAHEDLELAVGDDLLRGLGGGALDAGKVLGGDHAGYAKSAALGEQDLEARRLDGSVLVDDHAEGRARVRGQSAEHVGKASLHHVAEAHGAGVAHRGEADLAKALELLGILVHAGNEGDVDAPAGDDVHGVHLAVGGHEDAPVVVHEQGQSPAEVGTGVAVLLGEAAGLAVQGQALFPAHGGQGRPEGEYGLLGEILAQGKLGYLGYAQKIAPHDADGEGGLSAVAHLHEHGHEAGDEGLGVGGEDRVPALVVAGGHEGEEDLGELVGRAHGKGVLGVGLAQGGAHVAEDAHGGLGFLVGHVGKQEEVVVAANEPAHGVDLGAELGGCLGVHVEQP